MSTELVESGSNELAAAASAGLAGWGTPKVSAKDIVIPKILCMQGLSEMVADEKAKMGDLVDSVSKQIIGNCVKKPVEFIPFHMEKIWIISEKEAGGDFKFKEIVPITDHNENLRYTEVIGGVELKREYTRNFYVLRPEDTTLPYIISFKGMSSKAGKELASTIFFRNAAEGLNPAAKVMSLGGFKDKNAKGQFYVLTTSEARLSTEEEMQTALKWYKTVEAGATKAHEEPAADLQAGKEETRF